jgi:uncharacterized protein YqhQ
MVVGNFDIITIVTLLLVNFIFWKKRNKSVHRNIGCLLGILIFGLLLPAISQKLEIDRVVSSHGKVLDNFELLYTFMKFPIYWIVGIIQIILISKYFKNRT